jgi:DNA-directed RNA polymerase subunit M/transcription elongation factor TFIIS
VENEEEVMSRRREPSSVQCSECGAADAIQIEITLPDQSDVTFNSCHRCENRWWKSGASVLDLTTVLEKARRR